jgi:hypothetical protein
MAKNSTGVTEKALKEAIKLVSRDAAEKMDCAPWIEAYCRIENKSEEGAADIAFDLWPEQKNALEVIENNKKTVVLKARQLGLSWLCLCYILWRAFHKDGYTGIVLSQKMEMAKEMINRIRFILRHMPDWMGIDETEYRKLMKAGKPYDWFWWSHTSESVTIHRGQGGEDSVIIAQPASLRSARSLTADDVLFDEWAFHADAREIFTAALPTINRPDGSGRFIGISTNFRGSYFESVYRNAPGNGFAKVFLNALSDPRRDPEREGKNCRWYQETEATLGPKMAQEYPMTEEEALWAGENVMYPEFTKSVHVCEPFDIPPEWHRWASVDNGYNDPFFWLKFAISPDGITYAYWEYTRSEKDPKVPYFKQAETFMDSLWCTDTETGEDVPEKLDFIIMGVDAKNTARSHEGNGQTVKTTLTLYQEGGLAGMGILRPNRDRAFRAKLLHEYLWPRDDLNFLDENGYPKKYAKLQIFSTCPELIRQIPLLVRDDAHPDMVMDSTGRLKCEDHGFDSLTYGLQSSSATPDKAQLDIDPSGMRLMRNRARVEAANGRRSRRTMRGETAFKRGARVVRR